VSSTEFFEPSHPKKFLAQLPLLKKFLGRTLLDVNDKKPIIDTN
jgi:hypothetical protein